MKIIKEPNKLLHKKLNKIEKVTPQIKRLISNMKKTMVKNKGIGLAGNQVGEDLAIFVVDEELAKEYNAPSVYINPELKIYSKDYDEMEEGCLSIPETWINIKRAKKVKIKAMDEKGIKFKFIAKGLLARVLQHEYDHLNGILITERKNKKLTYNYAP